jgi:hypothetical protein
MKRFRRNGKCGAFTLTCAVLVFFSWGLPFAAEALDETLITYGLGIGGGFQSEITHEPTYTVFSVFPRADYPLLPYLDVEAEANYTHFNIKNEKSLSFLGLNGNLIFKPIREKWGSLFILAGAGLGYDDNRDNDVKELGSSGLGGILQAGVGANLNIGSKWTLRVEYRFYHISEPLINDNGLNANLFSIGFSF